MANVLLTGGAGYIGSHTAVALLSAGFDVVIADDLSNSDQRVIERLERISGKKVPFYKADASDSEAMSKLFEEQKIDGVIHFAAFKAVGESVQQPLRYYRNNIDCTLTVLELMHRYGVHSFIYSSSATVYGTGNEMPLKEDMPTGCTNPYGWTKLMNEQILRDTCAADKELSVVLLRYFNPIGAHESGMIGEMPNGIPNNLMPYISQVAIGKLERLNVFGDDYDTPDGTGVRDYIHVMDLAEGHVCALRYAMENKGIETVNLGTGRGYSVLDIINAFVRVTGVDVPYRIAPRREGDVAVCYADTEKAERVLGWKAKRGLDDMCADTWRWQKNNPRGYED